MDEIIIRQVQDRELAAWARVIADAQGRDHSEHAAERIRATADPRRVLGAFDRGYPVGGVALSRRRVTLPGGVIAEVGGQSWMGVAPTHRRRGIFTSLMKRQLSDLFEYGREAVAITKVRRGVSLAEFGYGTSSQSLVMSGPLGHVRLLPEEAAAAGRVALVDHEHALPLIEAVHARACGMHVGWVERDAVHWQAMLADVSSGSGAVTAARIAVYLDDEENPTGYALFRYEVRHDEVGRDNTRLHVIELAAVHRSAYTGLWRFLLSLSGAHEVLAECSLDEPVQQIIANPAELTWSVVDRLSVRLVDVARALGGRRYSSAVDVVIRVYDPFCPWNEGRYRLQGDQHGAVCARTSEPFDLSCSAADLASVYLGSSSLTSLALAGRVAARTTAALQDSSVAFRGFREPFCPQSLHWPSY